MRDLGAERHDVATLTTSYRCPEDVTALARHLLDPTLSPPRREDARNVGFARAAQPKRAADPYLLVRCR